MERTFKMLIFGRAFKFVESVRVKLLERELAVYRALCL